MKRIVTLLLIFASFLTYAQDNQRLTTIDFVEVLNNNKAETIYYYENNWKQLRIKAVEKNYIESFQLLETESTEDAPFTFMLITTYSNQAQYDLREPNFEELIKEKGGLKLLNEKNPGDFRKIIYSKDPAKHLE